CRTDEARGGQKLGHIGWPARKAQYAPHALSARGFHREREAVYTVLRARDECRALARFREPVTGGSLATFSRVIVAEENDVPGLSVGADGLVHINFADVPKAMPEQARPRRCDQPGQVSEFADRSVDRNRIGDASSE